MQKSFLNKHDPQMHINYVISLTSAYQRREHIQKEFSQQNIPFEFFDALKPSKELTSLMEKFIPNLLHAKLTEGEKSMFYEPLHAMAKMLVRRSTLHLHF